MSLNPSSRIVGAIGQFNDHILVTGHKLKRQLYVYEVAEKGINVLAV